MHKIMEEMQAIRARTTLENLRRNNMEASYAATAADALAALKSYLTPGCTVGVGGSVTLDEIGAIELLRSGDYNFLDRYAPGLTPAQMKDIFRRSLLSDVYVMSANAITENGELYNVDGRSNRVAALLFGPDSVVIIAGVNKIVSDIDEAIRRHKTVAAPANAARLRCGTPCVRTGKCVSLMRQSNESLCAGCASEDRICANYVVSARQREVGRIKVILVGENIGF
ncbi:MAG: lactate utilization protein [Ruminococcaceae bacterium]|nr:lactate utilization protein [Oscillospiraceae bacterium]